MQNHINEEILRIEREKPKHQLIGGIQLRSLKNDTSKRVMDITRKGVAQTESEVKLEDIKSSVDRFTVDKYFNKLSTSIAQVVNNYLQGIKQNDTGSIVADYNELCMFLKNVINWKTLSETDKNTITAKFNELIPQVNELMDVAITEKYTDVKQIEELRNNLMVRNYAPILYLNFAEDIKSKKPDYKTRKELSTKMFTLLNEPMLDDAIKSQIEDKIELYDEARNKFVSAKNADRKKFYKGILDKQERELNVYIDGIFESIPQIPRYGVFEPKPVPISEDEIREREEAFKSIKKIPISEILKRDLEKKETTLQLMGEEKEPDEEFNRYNYFDKLDEYNRTLKPQDKRKKGKDIQLDKEKEQQRLDEKQKYLDEYKQRQFLQSEIEKTAKIDIDAMQKMTEQNINELEREYELELSQIDNEIQFGLDTIKEQKFKALQKVDRSNIELRQIADEYNTIKARMEKYKVDQPWRSSKSKDPNVILSIKNRKDQHAKDSSNILKFNIEDVRKKEKENVGEVEKIRKDSDSKRKQLLQNAGIRKDKLKKNMDTIIEKESRQLVADMKKSAKLLPEVQLQLTQKKGDVLRGLKERELERKRQIEAYKPEMERRREERISTEEYYKEKKKYDKDIKAQYARERARTIKDEEQRLRQEEYEMFGEGKRRGRPRKIQGGAILNVERKLRNAIRKPFIPKNSNENDPSINIYPTYDLSQYDIPRIIKKLK